MLRGVDLSQVENGLQPRTPGIRCSDLMKVRKEMWSTVQFMKGTEVSLTVIPVRSPRKYEIRGAAFV